MNLFRLANISLVAATLLLAACTRPPLSDERVRHYWEAVQSADWPTAWAMERSAQTKQENPFQYYDRMRLQLRILSFELGEPQIQDDTAVLEIRQLVSLPFAEARYSTTVQLEDQWVYADGSWWHLKTTRPQPKPGTDDAKQAASDGESGAPAPASGKAEAPSASSAGTVPDAVPSANQ